MPSNKVKIQVVATSEIEIKKVEDWSDAICDLDDEGYFRVDSEGPEGRITQGDYVVLEGVSPGNFQHVYGSS